jgi:aryl-alcohol dehydrogenase
MSYGSCGRCASCRQGYRAYCHTANHFACRREDGSSYLHRGSEPVHGDFFAQSSFATRAIGSEHSVVKVRSDAPLEYLGPLGCGMQTGAGVILNDFRLAPGQSLAIFGVGSVGLSALMAARLSGAARIIAVDRHAHRLELARQLGVTDTIRAGNGSVTAQIKAIMPAGVDFSFDTTGIVEVMQQAVDVLAPMGTCSLVTGPWDGAKLPVSPMHLLKGRSVRGTSMGGADPATFIPRLVDFFIDGRFNYRPLVKFYPFEDIAQAFHDTESGATVKPILRIG